MQISQETYIILVCPSIIFYYYFNYAFYFVASSLMLYATYEVSD